MQWADEIQGIEEWRSQKYCPEQFFINLLFGHKRSKLMNENIEKYSKNTLQVNFLHHESIITLSHNL